MVRLNFLYLYGLHNPHFLSAGEEGGEFETQEFEDYLKEINLGHPGMIMSPLPKETWIGEGEARQILRFDENEPREIPENIAGIKEAIKKGIVKIHGEIHYCDIYGDEFTAPID